MRKTYNHVQLSPSKMTRIGKGARHLKLARAKRNATIKPVVAATTVATTATTYVSFDNIHEAHWEGLFESEEESEIEISEPEDDISEEAQNAFKNSSMPTPVRILPTFHTNEGHVCLSGNKFGIEMRKKTFNKLPKPRVNLSANFFCPDHLQVLAVQNQF